MSAYARSALLFGKGAATDRLAGNNRAPAATPKNAVNRGMQHVIGDIPSVRSQDMRSLLYNTNRREQLREDCKENVSFEDERAASSRRVLPSDAICNAPPQVYAQNFQSEPGMTSIHTGASSCGIDNIGVSQLTMSQFSTGSYDNASTYSSNLQGHHPQYSSNSIAESRGSHSTRSLLPSYQATPVSLDSNRSNHLLAEDNNSVAYGQRMLPGPEHYNKNQSSYPGSFNMAPPTKQPKTPHPPKVMGRRKPWASVAMNVLTPLRKSLLSFRPKYTFPSTRSISETSRSQEDSKLDDQKNRKEPLQFATKPHRGDTNQVSTKKQTQLATDFQQSIPNSQTHICYDTLVFVGRQIAPPPRIRYK